MYPFVCQIEISVSFDYLNVHFVCANDFVQIHCRSNIEAIARLGLPPLVIARLGSPPLVQPYEERGLAVRMVRISSPDNKLDMVLEYEIHIH